MNREVDRPKIAVDRPSPQIILTTAPNPGAIAILQMHGPGSVEVLAGMTEIHDWPSGRVRYVNLADIDDGCAVCLMGLAGTNGPWVQIMPHGGPRVVQKLIDHLVQQGCRFAGSMPPREIYPEAASDLEADMLAMLARAASSAAIDLLLSQPQLWANALDQTWDAEAILGRSDIFDRLIDPSTVVVVGAANVGKSTLTNRLLGRPVSIVADLPGTTRDWVAGLVELEGGQKTEDRRQKTEVGSRETEAEGESSCRRSAVADQELGDGRLESGGLGHRGTDSVGDDSRLVAVRWLDTPGLRTTGDVVEQRAIALARRVVADADVLIAMRDPQSRWPGADALPRRPDFWVLNKMDDAPVANSHSAGTRAEAPLAISALSGRGLDALQTGVLACLGLDGFEDPKLWAFTKALRTVVKENDRARLRQYVGT